MKPDERQRAILRQLATMGNAPARPASGIPTGFDALDEALGPGGLPRGRIVEIFGPAGCGKTTLALQIAARAQRDGLTPAWIDVDHAFDGRWAASLGVDAARMPLAQPESAEQALEIARTLVASCAVDLIVVDSAAALVPKLERSLGMGDAHGLHSRVLASGLQKLSRAAARAGASVLFLNQMRNRLDPAGTLGETSAGGPPLKLWAAVRIVLLPATARNVAVRVVKNKVAARAADRQLQWNSGSGFAESP